MVVTSTTDDRDQRARRRRRTAATADDDNKVSMINASSRRDQQQREQRDDNTDDQAAAQHARLCGARATEHQDPQAMSERPAIVSPSLALEPTNDAVMTASTAPRAIVSSNQGLLSIDKRRTSSSSSMRQ